MKKIRVTLFILGVTIFSVSTLAVSATIISDVHWDPAIPTTNDKIRIFARVTDPAGIKSVQLFHMLLRHFSPVGHMKHLEEDIWIIDIGPYNRNSINIQLVAKNQEGENSVSEVYTINLGKYRAIIRKYLPWVIVLLTVAISLMVYRRLRHQIRKTKDK